MMRIETGPRRAGRGGVVFGGALAVLAVYLCFTALQGEHGVFSLFRVEAQEHQLQAELDALKVQRAQIANKTQRLSTTTLDVELLDEQARKVLGLGRADEIIVR